MWPVKFLGTEARRHEIICVYAMKIILASQTEWLYANIVLELVPEKDSLWGRTNHYIQNVCQRMSLKIGLLQCMEMFEFTGT